MARHHRRALAWHWSALEWHAAAAAQALPRRRRERVAWKRREDLNESSAATTHKLVWAASRMARQVTRTNWMKVVKDHWASTKTERKRSFRMLVRRALFSRCTYMSTGWHAGADIRRARMPRKTCEEDLRAISPLKKLVAVGCLVVRAMHTRSKVNVRGSPTPPNQGSSVRSGHAPPYRAEVWPPGPEGGYMHPPTGRSISDCASLRYKGGGASK